MLTVPLEVAQLTTLRAKFPVDSYNSIGTTQKDYKSYSLYPLLLLFLDVILNTSLSHPPLSQYN